MPRLSIVIPNYNGLQHLQILLPTLVEHSPDDAEIIVVDDASTDDSVGWLRSAYPGVLIIQMPVNGGFCKACNEGLQRATGEIVVALNNDTIVMEGWWQSAMAHFEQPDVGSVAPLILKMHDPTIVDSAGCAYHACGWATDRGYGQNLSDNFRRGCEIFGPTMACAFYRRDALTITGLLPTEFGAYFEDIDLAFRLRWAGYRCVFEPSSRIHHVGSATYQKVRERVTRLLARNEELVFWSNLHGLNLALGALPHVCFQLIRLIRHGLSGRLTPFLQGKWEALRMLPFIRKRRRAVRRLNRENPPLILDWNLDVIARGLRWLRKRQN